MGMSASRMAFPGSADRICAVERQHPAPPLVGSLYEEHRCTISRMKAARCWSRGRALYRSWTGVIDDQKLPREEHAACPKGNSAPRDFAPRPPRVAGIVMVYRPVVARANRERDQGPPGDATRGGL
ncbi:hypothetical protein KM043_008112 [Ampulex compressa]|nr:hypothetical protein KM043_008112 [Ampulex compressa]